MKCLVLIHALTIEIWEQNTAELSSEYPSWSGVKYPSWNVCFKSMYASDFKASIRDI